MVELSGNGGSVWPSTKWLGFVLTTRTISIELILSTNKCGRVLG
jgi:hypothetical protein